MEIQSAPAKGPCKPGGLPLAAAFSSSFGRNSNLGRDGGQCQIRTLH